MARVQDKTNESPVRDVGLDGLRLVNPGLTSEQQRLLKLLNEIEGQRHSLDADKNLGKRMMVTSRVRRYHSGVFTHYEWYTQYLTKFDRHSGKQFDLDNFLYELGIKLYTLEEKLQDWKLRNYHVTPTHDYLLHEDFKHKNTYIRQDHWYMTKGIGDCKVERFWNTINSEMDRSDSLIGRSMLQDENFLTQRHMYWYAGLKAFRRPTTRTQNYIKCGYTHYGRWYGPLLDTKLELDYTDEDCLPKQGRVTYGFGNKIIDFKIGHRSCLRREDEEHNLTAEINNDIEQPRNGDDVSSSDEESVHSSDFLSDDSPTRLLLEEQNLDDYDNLFPRYLELRLRQVEQYNDDCVYKSRQYLLPYWEWEEDDWFWVDKNGNLQ